MNRPTDYIPALRSADLPPYVPLHGNETKPKTHKALVGIAGKGMIAVHHAARGHKFAFIETGIGSRWWFRRGAKSEDIFADLITAADANGRRWRIVDVISGEIRAEG